MPEDILGSADATDSKPGKSNTIPAEKQDALKEKALRKLRRCKSDMDNLARLRKKFLDAYMHRKYGYEIKGRSQFVASDLFDTIESILPSLLKIFLGGQDVVNMRPQGKEDAGKEKLMEEKVNFDFLKFNNGFLILHDFIKDSLLFRIGVVKSWWGEKVSEIYKDYSGLAAEQYFEIISNPDFQIDEYHETPIAPASMDPMTGQPIPPVMEYDLKGWEISRRWGPISECVPPEEFIFDRYAKDAAKMFCAHRKLMPKGEISVTYGIDEDEITSEITQFNTNLDVVARFSELDGVNFITPDAEDEDVYLYECYLWEYDKEKQREMPFILTLMGDRVLSVERNKYGRVPFSVQSPIRMTHRIEGISMAELLTDLQELHSALVRYMMDGTYFQVNNLLVANPFKLDMDALLNNNKPGGIITTLYDTDPNGAVAKLTPEPIQGQTFQLFELLNTMRENRTGVSRYNQGLDSRSLNRTATGISQIMGAAQQRIELLARMLAETGIRDLMQFYTDMNCQFFDKATSIQINGEWQDVSPESISGHYDVIIDVGLGVGAKEVTVNQMNQMLQTYGMIGQMVGGNPALMPFNMENVVNILKEIWQALGYKNVDQFVSGPPPPGMPPPGMPPGMDPMMIQQMMAQGGMNGPTGGNGPGAGSGGIAAQPGNGGGAGFPAPGNIPGMGGN